jgi:hypothetical protein
MSRPPLQCLPLLQRVVVMVMVSILDATESVGKELCADVAGMESRYGLTSPRHESRPRSGLELVERQLSRDCRRPKFVDGSALEISWRFPPTVCLDVSQPRCFDTYVKERSRLSFWSQY